MSRRVEFLALVEFGERFYTRKGVQVSFADRRAAVWVEDGPSTHAAVVSLAELRDQFAQHLDDPSCEWLLPILDALAAGGDADLLRSQAIAGYRERYGAEPEQVFWTFRD